MRAAFNHPASFERKSVMKRVVSFAALWVIATGAWAAAGEKTASPADGKSVSFQKTVLDTAFRSEGVAVGDFNSDGKLDIAAGSVYYAAPDWKMHLIAEKAAEYDPKNYSM